MRALLLLALTLTACQERRAPAPMPAPTPAPAHTGKVHLIDAADYPDAAVLIADQLAQSQSAGRTLLVYVGATWCEPCRYFHQAAERGELDAVLGDLDLLVFDHDKDTPRLEAAGYSSRLIPLLAVPDATGRASGKQMEGSIKGPGAVAQMTPRLKALLGR